MCGICGDRMTVRYHRRQGTAWPTYVCQRRGIAQAEPICQSIPGRGLDHAIGRVLLETVTPLTLEITLTVQQELQTRLDETDRLHRRAVERARYEADLARRRYLQVDPANRLVADELEAHWNRALQQVTEAQAIYERQRQADRVAVDADARARILALATDFPRLWHDPHTPDRERKRMVRLLMDDVTLIKAGRRPDRARPFSRWRDHHAHAGESAQRLAASGDQRGDRRADRSTARHVTRTGTLRRS